MRKSKKRQPTSSVHDHGDVELRPVSALRPYSRNARTHSKRQIKKIAASIQEFGFVNPILIDGDDQIIAGHGRCAAAKLLGLEAVPVLRISHLSEAQKRAYILADNRLAEDAGWDQEMLAIELQGLIECEYSVEATGFEIAEVDQVLEDEAQTKPPDSEDADCIPAPNPGPAVTRRGDLWQLGNHRLYCGDALDEASYNALLVGAQASLVFTDPPYNVPIDGHVSGLGKQTHREFAMACGEMTAKEFTQFLSTAFGHMARHSQEGSIHYICMDWRHGHVLSVSA